MKKNMGTVDRGIRVALAIVVAILYFTGKISGIAAIVLGIIALVFVITSLVGHCPAYTPLGIKTFKDNK
jgi:K+-transporting ATPase A subunit